MSDSDHQPERRHPCETSSCSPPGLRKELNVFDAGAVVVGTIIGSGICCPDRLAWRGFVGLGTWRAADSVQCSVPGRTRFDLSRHRRSVHLFAACLRPTSGFLYAWALLVMVHSGSIAALGVAFGLYSGQIFQLDRTKEKICRALPNWVLNQQCDISSSELGT